MQESMTDAVRRSVVATGTTRELARKLARRFDWHGTEEVWVIRVCQMLSGKNERRRFPADAIPDAIDVTGDVSLLAPAHAAVIRAQAESPRALAKVRHPRREVRRA